MPNNRPLSFCLHLTAAFLTSAMTAHAADTKPTNQQWQCAPAASGQGWTCGPAQRDSATDIEYEPVTVGPAATGRATGRFSAPKVESAPAAAQRQLDWVPREQMTPAQQAQVPAYCAGAYVEPDYVDPQLRDLDPASQPLQASSITSTTTDEGVSTLEGDVVVQQGYRRLASDKATVNRETGIANIPGEGEYREPGILLIGSNTEVNLETKAVTTHDVKFVTHANHLRGEAQIISRSENEIIYISDGRLSRCPPASNAWELRAKKITLDQEKGVGVAKHATLRVKDVPVLYTPYVSFPIDDRRKSGFLFPELGNSDDGFDIATPYYLNLAPNYDATITPRYISDRGAGIETEFRWLTSNSENSVGGSFLPDDDKFENNLGQEETQDRWLVNAQNRGTLFNTIRTRVDFTRVSDDEYFSDLGTGLNTSSTTHLRQLGQANYSNRFWKISARVQGFQTIDEFIADNNRPYDTLPQITVNGAYPFANDVVGLGIRTQYSYFDRDNDDLTGLSQAVGHRLIATPSVTLNFEWPFAYIRPQVKYRHVQYDLEDLSAGFDDSPDVSVPIYSLDTGLFFERDTSLFGDNYVQTFEPRLFYLNIDDEDQSDIPDFDTSELTFSYNQLFRENRFSGGDRIGDANQLSVGLTTRLVNDAGNETLRLSVGQIFYFEDRDVTLSTQQTTPLTTQQIAFNNAVLARNSEDESSYAAEIAINLSSGWHLFGDIEWDPNENRTNESSVRIRYASDNRRIFNIGYRVRNNQLRFAPGTNPNINNRQRLEQTDISFIWPVSNHWSLIGRWNQDIINDQNIETLAGIQYESCCWVTRLVGRRWINDDDANLLDPNNVDEKDAIYLQIQFKGLGGLGSSLDGILDDSIPSYRQYRKAELGQ